MQSNTRNYSLDLLKRINLFVLNNPVLFAEVCYKGYNLWHFKQQNLFQDIMNFAQGGEYGLIRQSIAASIRSFVLSSFAIFFSLLSLLFSKKVLLYSPDKASLSYFGDFRIEGVYKFLRENNIKFIEIFHSLLGRGFVLNIFKRKRPALYLESLDAVFYLLKNIGFFKNKIVFDLDFNEGERKFVQLLIERYLDDIKLSKFKIKALSQIFRLTNIRVLLSIDDTRYYNELIFACKENNIKTYVFQHGRFNKYVVGFINYEIPPKQCIVPDTFFVWNEYWREKLISLSPTFNFYKQNIVIGGKPFFEKEIAETVADDVLTILVPYEIIGAWDEIREYIKGFLKCPGVEVVFKLRADMPTDNQVSQLKDFLQAPNFKVMTNLTPDDWSRIDIVSGTYSTLLYESAEAGKGVGVLKTISSEARDLVEDGLADWVNLDNICRQIYDIAKTDTNILERRKNILKTKVDIQQTLKTILYDTKNE